MDKPNVVIYHGKCPDGFAAAFAAWLKLGDTAEYLPYQYGMKPPEVAGKSVFILDFSFELEDMQAMDAVARKVVLLDHHKTAIDKLGGYRCRCSTPTPGLITPTGYHYEGDESYTLLDTSRSGARLAWLYFHPDEPVPQLIRLIEDRDLWKWKYGDLTRHYLAKLDSLPQTFESWRSVLSLRGEELSRFVAEGAAMCVKFDSLVESIASRAVPVTLFGQQGLMVNTTAEFASDVGALLARRCGTFGLMWTMENGYIKLSLRSVPEFEVRELAERLGGGGHPCAAAARLPAERFADIARGVIE